MRKFSDSERLEADNLNLTHDTTSAFDNSLNNPIHFCRLGKIAQDKLAPYLSNNDLLTLRLLDKACDGLFKPVLRQRQGALALQHASRARADNVKKLFAMLKVDPSLLLERFDVIASDNGDRITNMTIYEICLCRSPELAHEVAPYFNKITLQNVNGVDERNKQYAKYKPAIDKLFTQGAYDWSNLLRKVKEASKEEIDALLTSPTLHKSHRHYHSELYQAMLTFRSDWAPCEFDGNLPTMHDVRKTKDKPPKEYSLLMSLWIAHFILSNEWNNLIAVSTTAGDKNKYNRIRLVWRQVIGFMARRLMGEDRCHAAQGLYYRFHENRAFERTDKLIYAWVPGVTHFHDTQTDGKLGKFDLGGGFSIDMCYAGAAESWAPLDTAASHCFGKFISSKEKNHAQHPVTQPGPDNQSIWCVVS